MKKISIFFLFVLSFSLPQQIDAQNSLISLKQDSLLSPVLIQNGNAQINKLKLFQDKESLENLYLEVRVPPQAYSKIYVQNIVRIEVVRLVNGKKEYIEIARIFLPWFDPKNNQDDVFLVDISAYSPLFMQEANLQIESNNPAPVKMSLRFQWKKGQAPADIKRIVNLWHSTIVGLSYADKTKPINQQVKTKSIHITKDIKYALLKIYLSGSGQETKIPSEEECSKFYFLNINGQTIAKRPIWRDDCSLNSFFPQSGPWMYSRANWCPGQALRVYDHIIPLGSDTTLSIDLQFQEAIKANPLLKNYVLSANLILFGNVKFKNDAALVEILAPNKSLAHNRYNPICGSPVIRIRNTGADTLRTVLIQYGLDVKTDNRYRWRGELAFMEEEIVYLPPLNWYFYNQKKKPSEFYVSIAEVNQKKDENPENNKLSTALNLAPVYPNQISIQFVSNHAASDNILELVDDMGIPFFEAADFVNDSVYSFDLNLQPGCYEFVIYDQQGDGIYFPGNKKGKGSLKIFDTNTKAELKNFEPNFGSESRQQFMILK